jgi:hypothetical protein
MEKPNAVVAVKARANSADGVVVLGMQLLLGYVADHITLAATKKVHRGRAGTGGSQA